VAPAGPQPLEEDCFIPPFARPQQPFPPPLPGPLSSINLKACGLWGDVFTQSLSLSHVTTLVNEGDPVQGNMPMPTVSDFAFPKAPPSILERMESGANSALQVGEYWGNEGAVIYIPLQ
jgi:hypothetical protein